MGATAAFHLSGVLSHYDNHTMSEALKCIFIARPI
jgi:hypothetical protein